LIRHCEGSSQDLDGRYGRYGTRDKGTRGATRLGKGGVVDVGRGDDKEELTSRGQSRVAGGAETWHLAACSEMHELVWCARCSGDKQDSKSGKTNTVLVSLVARCTQPPFSLEASAAW
jgi:hypothetical protein